ncbi:MAG: DUF342 domain-containing protein [Planctomycetes bacterium]|nr:DUF342 domain-containing protein [Planctomycetota bacterium]
MPLTANKLFRVTVSNDNLTATLSLNLEAPPGAISAEEILSQVEELGILVDDDGQKNIEVLSEAFTQEETPEPIVIARGTPPQNDTKGIVEKLYDKASESGESSGDEPDRQSHYDRTDIVTVTKDQQVIRLVPPIPGTNGQDVYGKEIPRKLAREVRVRLGTNVRQEQEYIISDCDGVLEYKGDKVWVNSKLEIAGNVDFSVGNIDFSGDIFISKNVQDLFKVRSGNDIVINGVAEAAEVHADQDLEVVNGMTGKDKGIFSAGRDLKGKYITNAKVQAGHNIEIRTEIVQSQVVCGGQLIVEHGSLVGGRIVAAGGVKVKDLGSEANVKTIIEVGIDEDVRTKYDEVADEVKLRRLKAEKVRKVVEPLLQNQKHLTADQKEKATELLYQASELEDSAEQMVEELREVVKLSEERTVAEIEVFGKVYSGVTIRFPQVETAITKTLSGPVKIAPRKIDGSLRVASVDDQSGNVRDLGAMPFDNEFWESLEELLRVDSE